MPWIGGALAGAGALAGGIFNSNAASDAASAAVTGQNNSIDFQRQVLMALAQRVQPWLSAGTNALSTYGNQIGASGGPNQAPQYASYLGVAGGSPTSPFLPTSQFTASPGYQYELQQQQQAIQNSGAGRSGALSGNTLQALQGNAQGLASQDYWTANNNWYNNIQKTYGADTSRFNTNINALLSLANAGQNAAIPSSAQPFAANIGGAYANIGGANAAGILGSANALTSGFNGAANQFNPNSNILAGLQQMFGTGSGNFTDPNYYGNGNFGGGGSF